MVRVHIDWSQSDSTTELYIDKVLKDMLADASETGGDLSIEMYRGGHASTNTNAALLLNSLSEIFKEIAVKLNTEEGIV